MTSLESKWLLKVLKKNQKKKIFFEKIFKKFFSGYPLFQTRCDSRRGCQMCSSWIHFQTNRPKNRYYGDARLKLNLAIFSLFTNFFLQNFWSNFGIFFSQGGLSTTLNSKKIKSASSDNVLMVPNFVYSPYLWSLRERRRLDHLITFAI